METARLDLPASPAAAGVARLFVRCLCQEWGVGPVADTAVLLSSELVTNAVVHASSRVEVEVAQDGDVLRVDVRDCGPGQVALPRSADGRPPAATVDLTAEGGRGLAIVASLASSWGVDEEQPGKRVWFTLPTSATG